MARRLQRGGWSGAGRAPLLGVIGDCVPGGCRVLDQEPLVVAIRHVSCKTLRGDSQEVADVVPGLIGVTVGLGEGFCPLPHRAKKELMTEDNIGFSDQLNPQGINVTRWEGQLRVVLLVGEFPRIIFARQDALAIARQHVSGLLCCESSQTRHRSSLKKVRVDDEPVGADVQWAVDRGCECLFDHCSQL